jgi:hypothetical protein
MNYSSFLRLFEELVNLKETSKNDAIIIVNLMIMIYLNIFMKFPFLTNYDALNFIKSSWEDFQSHNAITFAIIYNNTL